MPKDEQAMEGWVKAVKESDDGMCQGWRDQIDTLIIFVRFSLINILCLVLKVSLGRSFLRNSHGLYG